MDSTLEHLKCLVGVGGEAGAEHNLGGRSRERGGGEIDLPWGAVAFELGDLGRFLDSVGAPGLSLSLSLSLVSLSNLVTWGVFLIVSVRDVCV